MASAPVFTFALPSDANASEARSWVYELPSAVVEAFTTGVHAGRFRSGLEKAAENRELDFAVLVRRRAGLFIVFTVPAPVQKQRAMKFLQRVCKLENIDAGGVKNLEALDAFFCEVFGWAPPPDPAGLVAAAMQTASEAPPGSEAETLRQHLPALLGNIEDRELRDWYKGGLLGAALLTHLVGRSDCEVEDCSHELRRGTRRDGCVCDVSICTCGAEERFHAPCGACAKSGENAHEWNCRRCGQRWCHPCAMQVKGRLHNESAIQSLAALVADASRKTSYPRVPGLLEDWPPPFEAAEDGRPASAEPPALASRAGALRVLRHRRTRVFLEASTHAPSPHEASAQPCFCATTRTAMNAVYQARACRVQLFGVIVLRFGELQLEALNTINDLLHRLLQLVQLRRKAAVACLLHHIDVFTSQG